MTRPLTREFTTVWESVVYTVIYRIVSGIYSLIYAVLFEGGAIIAQTVTGLASDLRHSDYKYAEHVGTAIKTGLSKALSGILWLLSWIWSILQRKR